MIVRPAARMSTGAFPAVPGPCRYLPALLLFLSLTAWQPAAAQDCGVPSNPLTNCGFETGDFTGWVTVDVLSPFAVLEVGGAGRVPWFEFFSTDPPEGSFSASHGFDGTAGTIELGQDVTLLPGTTTLEFEYRAAYDLLNWGASLDRSFDVLVEPAGGGAALQTTNILMAEVGAYVTDTGVLTGSVDLSAFADQCVRINFVWTVPQDFAGPGAFEIDNVRINGGIPRPELTVLPSALTLHGTTAGTALGSVIVQGTSCGLVNYTVTTDQPWLSVSPASASTTGEVDTLAVTGNGTSLGAGGHGATISITTEKGPVFQVPVNLLLEDVPGPSLIIEPATLSFDLRQDDEPASRNVRVRAVNGVVQYSIRPGASWMNATPDKGSSSGEADVIQVWVDPRGLPPGTYAKDMFITSRSARLRLPITLRVEEAPPPPAPAITSLHNLANPELENGDAVAPGAVVVLNVDNLASEPAAADSLPLPRLLGDTSVTINDSPASLFSVSPGRIELQWPWEVSAGTATIVAHGGGAASQPFPIIAGPHAPAVFTVSGSGSGQGLVTLANSSLIAGPEGPGSRPAFWGDVLAAYVNGLGSVTPSIGNGANSCNPASQCLSDFSNLVLRETAELPRVLLNGAPIPEANILFSGLSPEHVGLHVVYFVVHANAPVGDAVSFVVEIGGERSSADVTIAISGN